MTLAERHSAVGEWVARATSAVGAGPVTVRLWPGTATAPGEVVVDVRVEGVGVEDTGDGHVVETAVQVVVAGPVNLAHPEESEQAVMTVVSDLLDSILADQSLGGALVGEAVRVGDCGVEFLDVDEPDGFRSTSADVRLVLVGRPFG